MDGPIPDAGPINEGRFELARDGPDGALGRIMRVAHISMNIEYFIDNNVEAETWNTGYINDKMAVAAAAESAMNVEDMARGEGATSSANTA